MKRVFDGKIYDTAGARRVATWKYQANAAGDENVYGDATLYWAAPAAFFAVYVESDDPNRAEDDRAAFFTITAQEAMGLPTRIDDLAILAPDILPYPPLA